MGIYFFLTFCLVLIPINSQELMTVHEVVTVLGMLTNLPCNITPPYADDQVNLVLWYKDGHGKPLFGFDLRDSKTSGSGLSRAISTSNMHNNNNNNSTSKVQFNANSEPTAVLSLFGVSAEDAGLYKCRVDFKRSPTRFWKVNLTVIVPPSSSVIRDKNGLAVGNNIVLDEFKTLALTCDVIGGMPSSVAQWWMNGEIIDNSFKVVAPGRSRNSLKLAKMERKDNGQEIMCVGMNNNETQPVSSSVKINVNLSPFKTEIIKIEQALVAGKQYKITCISEGGFPSTSIVWLIDGKALEGQETEISVRGNVTENKLLFTPKRSHSNRTIQCRSKNPILQPVLMDAMKMTVEYVPEVTIRLGSSLKASNIREGDDIYFECLVEANPKETAITWWRDGSMLIPDRQNGITINRKSLILQNVGKTSAGSYSCQAQNEIGTSSSSMFPLSIKFAPYCTSDLVNHTAHGVGIALDKQIKIACQVESNPPPNNFIWRFNTSKEIWDVRKEDIVIDGFLSVASVVVERDDQYQNLLCWAENELGTQDVPCMFYLLPESKPEPLQDCVISNKTYHSITIECLPGKSVGLQQTFLANIYQVSHDPVSTYSPTENASIISSLENNHFPHFSVKNLGQGQNVKIVLFAKNEKGRSKTHVLYGSTLKKAERQIDPNEWDTLIGRAHILFIFLLIAVILSSLICFIFVASKFFPKRRSNFHNSLQDPRRHVGPIKMSGVLPSDQSVNQEHLRNWKWDRSGVVIDDQMLEGKWGPGQEQQQQDEQEVQQLVLAGSPPQIPEGFDVPLSEEVGLVHGGEEIRDERGQLTKEQVQLIDKLLQPKQLEDFCTKLTRF